MVHKEMNKVDKKSGHFLCAKCGEMVPLGTIYKGLVYHSRCLIEVKESHESKRCSKKTPGTTKQLPLVSSK